MQKIVLDVIPSGIRPRVYVNQYDIGREFQITFKEGLGEYYFANGTTIKINGKKADNHVFEYTQSDKWDSTHYIISTSGSGASIVVTIATAEQMTAAAGDADVQLTLQNSAGAVIGTLDFVMVVQARPSASGDPSESDLPDVVRSVNNIPPDANGNVQLGPVPGGIGAHNISTVEATRQMSTSYSAGDYVYVTADDQLYKITSPIGSGGTLTPGTNAVSCTISSDLASVDISSLVTKQYTNALVVTATKNGKNVFLTIELPSTAGINMAQGDDLLVTLDNSIQPISACIGKTAATYSAGEQVNMPYVIAQGGSVTLRCIGDVHAFIASFTYQIAQ